MNADVTTKNNNNKFTLIGKIVYRWNPVVTPSVLMLKGGSRNNFEKNQPVGTGLEELPSVMSKDFQDTILEDRVFEPTVGTFAWRYFETIFGTGDGAGIGLLLLIGGLALISALIFSFSFVRNLESLLPDDLPQSTEE